MTLPAAAAGRPGSSSGWGNAVPPALDIALRESERSRMHFSFVTFSTAAAAEQAWTALQDVAWQEESGRHHWLQAKYYNADAAAAARGV